MSTNIDNNQAVSTIICVLFCNYLISFCGILWVMTQGSIENLLALQFNIGDLMMLIAVIFWSVYSIYVKKTAGVLTPLSLFGYSSIFGVLLLVPASLVELSVHPIQQLGLEELMGFFYLGIFPSIGSFLFWNRAVLLIGPSRASVFQNLVPVWGIMFSFLILSEKITSAHLLGGMMVFIGVLLSRVKPNELVTDQMKMNGTNL